MVHFFWGPILPAKPVARKAWCESDREEGLESDLTKARREKLVARELGASGRSADRRTRHAQWWRNMPKHRSLKGPSFVRLRIEVRVGAPAESRKLTLSWVFLVRRSPHDVDMPEICLSYVVSCSSQNSLSDWRGGVGRIKELVRGLYENFWSLKGKIIRIRGAKKKELDWGS